jgi:cytochrome P450
MTLLEGSLEDRAAALLRWDLDWLRDPLPLLNRLREETPVYWVEEKGVGLVFPYRLVKDIYRDTTRFWKTTPPLLYDNRALLSDEENRMADDLLAFNNSNMANNEGTEHRRIRSIANPMFTRSSMRGFEDRVQRLTDEILDEIELEDEPDFQNLAWRLPVLAMMDLVGAPREDAELLKRLSEELLAWFRVSPWPPASVRASHEALQEFKDYSNRLVEDHRRHPRENLTSLLIAALDSGTLRGDELPSQITLFITAGHETTADLISKGLLALLTQRDQYERLVADPSLAASAVEELVRYEAVVTVSQRFVATDVDLEGIPIPAGANITMYNTAANHDPDVFDRPECIDITRKPNEHVGWGYGAHFCIGAPLARLEGARVFETVARRYPDLELRVPRMEVEVIRRPPRERPEFCVPVALGERQSRDRIKGGKR